MSKILLVGEGNFSFGNILSQSLESAGDTDSGIYSSSSSSLPGKSQEDADTTPTPTTNDLQVIATDCNQDFFSNPKNDSSRQEEINTIRKNIASIKMNGGIVLLDVDCASLERHDCLRQHREAITKIIFNFPHVKRAKMHIGLNRDLLCNFFQSAGKFLNNVESSVEVIVTLCSGQSGINQVEKKRRGWADSWQLIEQAALGSFILKRTEPFPDFWIRISGSGKKHFGLLYSSCGYRNRPSSFNYEDATTFTFVQRSPPTPNFITTAISTTSPTSISDDTNYWDDEDVQVLSGMKINPDQNSLDPLSIDESLAFYMYFMCESMNNKMDSPYHVIKSYSDLFVDPDDPVKFALRLNFEDGVVDKFDFYSAVTVWIKSIKVTNSSLMFDKLKTFFRGMKQSEVILRKKEKTCHYQHEKFGVFVRDVHIGDISFPTPEEVTPGYWDLNLSNLLKLRQPVGTDMRCIFSEYGDNQNFTDSLYPRIFFYETSLWAMGPHFCPGAETRLNEDTDPVQIFQNIKKVAVLVYGPLLKGIEKIQGEEFLKKDDRSFGTCETCGQHFDKISYNYSLELQSIDKPLSKKVANSFHDAFRSALKTFLKGVVEVR